jgi:hypothetical protein
MQNALIEKFVARLLGFTGAFTTIFLISSSVTDPVNAPKLLVIGICGTAIFSVVLFSSLRTELYHQKLVIILVLFFLACALSSAFFSQAPLSQVIYGAYGRNNGLLAYFFLVIILVSALCLKSISNFRYISTALFIAGGVNLVYCMWVILFGDFIGWSNPYGNILGTLGNPNFIGAFLGIFFAALVVLLIGRDTKKEFRILALAAIPICAYEIIQSHAIQGRIVAAAGTAVVLFLYIRGQYSRQVLLGYSVLTVTFGAFALGGALQIGPLTQYIYKRSVSLRGQYWLASWNTGKEHPFTGVGMDTFGDWYRRMRDIHALELPGVNTVVNAAHNVPLDMFAFGGWPLFVSYLAIFFYVAISIIKVIKRQRHFEPSFAILVASWAGYQLQSIISINQIGLAVWGWLLSGAIIAYEKMGRDLIQSPATESNLSQSRLKKTKIKLPAQIPLIAVFGGFLGLILALPPLSSDASWRSAQLARSLPPLEATMKPSYFNPSNSMKFLTNIQTLEGSQLFELSHKYALEAVKWNPDSFELWKVLYLLKNSSPEEKDEALKNMKRLDPLNPDVTSIQ